PEQIFEHPERELTRRFIRRLKVLEIPVEEKVFDFIGAGSEIDRYCMKNDIPPRTKYHIRLCFEELVQQILASREEVYPIRFVAEYTAEGEGAQITVSYGGGRFDPADTDNELSYILLKKTAQDVRYTRDESAKLPNIVEVTV
ncbi:MAG: hypothetical protein IJP92_05760, partial [Lachnospiraceae bacterium]|nr:hypothetical protein [Lachnospiraceae bacterium]